MALFFLTPFLEYGSLILYYAVIILWFITAQKIDKFAFKGTRFFIFFFVYILAINAAFSINHGNLDFFKKCLGGQILSYFSFYFYSFYSRHLRLFDIVLKFLILFLLISAAFTIIGNSLFYQPSRALANPEDPNCALYRSLFIGGYEYIYAIVLFVPPFVYHQRMKKGNIMSYYIPMFCIAILSYCILMSSYTTAILLTLIGTMAAFVKNKNLKTIIISFSVIFIIVYLLKDVFLLWLYNFGESIDSYALTTRSRQLLEGSYSDENGDLGRDQRFINGLLNFISSPLWGQILGNTDPKLADHSGLGNYLDHYGLMGIIFYKIISVIYKKTKESYRNLRIQNYYNIYIFLALFLFLVDTFDYNPSLCFMAFFVGPCLIKSCEIFSSTKNIL